MNLTNKYALVTGGAHRVGKAIAVELARAGAHVAVHYRSAGAAVSVELWAEGPQEAALSPDVAAALAAEPEAQVFFNGLATFYRKGFINGIENAKRPETRTRKIAEMMALLKAGKKQK